MNWIDKKPNGITTSQGDLKNALKVNLGNIAILENITREEAEAVLLDRINEEFQISYKNISEITGNCLRKVLRGTRVYLRELHEKK